MHKFECTINCINDQRIESDDENNNNKDDDEEEDEGAFLLQSRIYNPLWVIL